MPLAKGCLTFRSSVARSRSAQEGLRGPAAGEDHEARAPLAGRPRGAADLGDGQQLEVAGGEHFVEDDDVVTAPRELGEDARQQLTAGRRSRRLPCGPGSAIAEAGSAARIIRKRGPSAAAAATSLEGSRESLRTGRTARASRVPRPDGLAEGGGRLALALAVIEMDLRAFIPCPPHEKAPGSPAENPGPMRRLAQPAPPARDIPGSRCGVVS